MNVELDVNALKDILSTFAGRMGAKWDFIGIQLRQGELVQDLRSSPQLGKQKVQQIVDEWLGSEDDEEVPVCPATVSRVLRSPAVRLGAVAKDFEKEVQRRASSQCAASQCPVSRPPHDLPPTGAYPSTDTSTSHFEGTLSLPDGPSPSNPHGVSQEPLSSNPPSFSQRQPSNPSSLALPQQAQEGELGPHIPGGGGGGRADSGPVQVAGSLAQQPIEEQGGPAEGDVLRGPEQDGDAVHDGPVPVMEDVLEAITKHIKGVLRDHYSRPPGNEAAMAKSFGQRCIPFHEQARIASAVCRTVWNLQIEGKKIYGSGSIVSCLGKFFLLTCCHNFLKKEDGERVQSLEDDYVEKKMKKKCKVAEYLFSTRDFKRTVPLRARVVLKNCEDPVLIFDQAHDLLAVEVNNPDDFPAHLPADAAAALIPVQPIPLQPALKREKLLESALLLTIAHFPREDGHRAECLELAVGLRLFPKESRESLVYTFDTYHGSSGAPVLFAEEGEVVLLAVHRKSTAKPMMDAAGQRTNIGYNVGSVLSQSFLRRLCPNDQGVSDSTV